MPIPKIASITPYTGQGTSRWIWCETLANPAAPTRAELQAGVDISEHVCDVSGFAAKTSNIDVPNISTRQVGNIPGAEKPEDSAVETYMAKNGADTRVLMPKDTVGFLVELAGGDVPGYKSMSVFWVTISSHARKRNAKGSEADTNEIQMAVQKLWENLTVPAAA